MTTDLTDRELLYFNGIDGETGAYSLRPMSGRQFASYILGESPPEILSELRFRQQRDAGRFLGVKEGVDPTKLEEAGWGVIFAQDADPAIKDALGELLKLRREQAGEYFKVYEGPDGYQPGESKGKFLARHGAGPGPADPDKVPYYLLIVGSPEAIPYRFQSQLDVQYAVGRIHFNTLEEYASYARSVVAAEKGAVKLSRQAAFFGVTNGDDPATKLSATELAGALAEKFRADDKLGWETTAYLSDQATKARLVQLLGGDQTPALLFAASHGNALSLTNPHQRCHQGALICCDWPGAEEWAGRGPIPQKFYFAGDDLDSGANLLGLIGFFFACFGAGTPLQDEFAKRFLRDQRQDIAPYPFLAQLPVRMLGHPRGGALAVIGHVERAWPTSFRWSGGAGPQIEVFESTLRRLLAGHPVGSAVEYFNERYAELAVMLSDELEEIEFQKQYVPGELATLWTANNDARGYAIVGDPAVRLPVVEDATDQIRSAIEPVRIAGSPAKDARPQSEICPPDASTAASFIAARSTRAASSASLTDRQAEAALDQLFSYSPLPTVPPDYKQEHPELYQAWVDHIEAGYKNNDEVFQQVLKAFMRSHDATVMMYWILFGLGVSAFVAAIVLGLVRESVVYSVLFGGLSVVSFVTYFIGRSTQAVEENLQFITWLGIIFNSYWTHLAWAFDAESAGETLDKATTDAIQQLRQLIDRHAEATRKRPGLGREQANQTGGTNGRQSDEQASTNGSDDAG